MRNITKRMTVAVICAIFGSVQLAFADAGLSNASINTTSGGYAGSAASEKTLDLNFTGSSHVDWNTLNVASDETLNFNAVNGAAGLTVLNTVSGGSMTYIYGTVNANSGIAKLIISNPSGVLFDGARFTTAGDTMITTQPMTATFDDYGVMTVSNVSTTDSVGVVTIKNSDFSIGGEFNILSPYIGITGGTITAADGLKLITQNGQDYLAAGNSDSDKGVRLEAINVNGDVYIVADKGIVKTVNGGTINGNLDIQSADSIALNYVSNGETLYVTGGVTTNTTDGQMTYLKNAEVGGNLNMTSSGGFIEVGDSTIAGNANITTTGVNTDSSKYNHFVHVTGDTTVGGDMTIESSQNIHIGGYDYDTETLADGSLTVGGTLTAHATDGHVTVTIDTAADRIALASDNYNVLTDGEALLTADEYSFSSNGYIGGLSAYGGYTTDQIVIEIMENYKYLSSPGSAITSYLNIAGGTITDITTPAAANILSNGDVTLTGADAGQINITAPNHYIEITGDGVAADTITVGKETDKLKVDYPSRNYTLKYTNIKDGEEVTIAGSDEITYELTNAEGGYNDGTQTAGETTYLVGPDAEETDDTTTGGDDITVPDEDTTVPDDDTTVPDDDTTVPDDDTTVPDADTTVPDDDTTAEEEAAETTAAADTNTTDYDSESSKLLKGYDWRDANDITAEQPSTPVAYAADLDDDEIDAGVRKNVDGSVTVVRAYPMGK